MSGRLGSGCGLAAALAVGLLALASEPGAVEVAEAEPRRTWQGPGSEGPTAQTSAAVRGWKYRFVVPLEVHRLLPGVSKVEVTCQVCKRLEMMGHHCVGPEIGRPTGTTVVPIQDGEGPKQVEVYIQEHVMEEIPAAGEGVVVVTKGLKYRCKLLLDGVQPGVLPDPVERKPAGRTVMVTAVPADGYGDVPQ